MFAALIKPFRYFLLLLSTICLTSQVPAQQRYELNSDWYCANINDVKANGEQLSQAGFQVNTWMRATVPGTVLTTLLNNNKVPDPFYGMNNKLIKDVYHTGNAYYTYWFVKSFKQVAQGDEQVWLQFRGVNYKAEIFLNGKKVNAKTHEGMHLRQQYNITKLLAPNGNNRLAVLVYPPDFPGDPNGGQGGDGTIAKGLTTQYTAGWDWIQPIRDRNTGIWDKVTIEKTNSVNVENPHVVTLVPGKRLPMGAQAPAVIRTSSEISNPTTKPVQGFLQYNLAGKLVRTPVTLKPGEKREVKLPDLSLANPKLWWPNGYGEQYLYQIRMQFVNAAGKVLDEEPVQFGVREISNVWNDRTQSMEARVNGQKIFIKGGNWIISDAMLRFSDARYDAEVRFHRDMNLNLIRIWGGALTERPEFYQACDKYGLLVFQDFWFSGDCNGKWVDPLKKEDQWTRRQYPDNHQLALEAAADQIKLIRNHPSLAFWCGGNEITPPDDILEPLKNKLLPELDGTRYFFDFSNTDSMSYNSIGGNGDGPYNIQDIRTFWGHKTYPYNSEVGSVGVGDYASLQRFIPAKNLIAPQNGEKADSVWEYHKYIPYNQYIDPYGKAKNAADFAMKAQLVNYNQYRALMEGFSSHMWDWYTGSIIWKTQNPWTALRGQMYDYYLDVNACLYGLRKGSEPLHIMMNPLDSMIQVVNNGFKMERNLMVQANVYDMNGKLQFSNQLFAEIGPSMVKKMFPINDPLKKGNDKNGVFVVLKLLASDQKLLSENLYWLPGKDGQYNGLQEMKPADLKVAVETVAKGKLNLTLENPSNGPIAFFNRIALENANTGMRILPTFFSDNYVSILPGEKKTVTIEFPDQGTLPLAVRVYGWNVKDQQLPVK
ncbi:glycoside hydrolase family 2 TIM barrel-domain containing protein [Pedobacter sp. KR3-3]|uniref:Glycoside hydrolase family 2 TIM barrel-domain containing protein n=1 Tax=Pedobacter albus TaxID=3113905 RepID=A0ABU7I6K5_9SPHI|nr:glycoside hydrolase family 2 TIM barrel-domain containing protein [Pedobacter sp. KR3-3]MEE1944874.1 glycoside hydrolase family 2 TIM barrel-domain containing protein [Pedobacter sp. KR3-3]